MVSSLRFALRSFRRSPGFSLLAVLILALGIGATTAMFSITQTVLLKPLPYFDSGRLITILFRVPQFSKQLSTIPVNAQHYFLWRDHARSFREIGIVGWSDHILTGRGETIHIEGARVSSNVFHVLGVQPMLGRNFANGEDTSGREQVVIVSHGFWQNKLGGRRDVLGQKLMFDGKPYEIVGVMPAAFPFPRGRQLSDLAQLPARTDYWVPLVFSKEDLESPLANMNYLAIARLKHGVSMAQSQTEMQALEKVIAKTFPEPVEVDPQVRSVQQDITREVQLPLLVLMTAVSAVLLIVCINLANLFLVRALGQRREWAIRLAVGAALQDVLQAAFLESFLLAVSGGVLGSVLAFWALELIRIQAPLALPRSDEMHLDIAGLAFALAASLASALFFGIWPAWRAAQTDPQEALQSSAGRSATEGRSGQSAGKLLVGAEVAVSTALLLSASLLVKSYASTLSVDPGMSVEHVLTADITLPPQNYAKASDIDAFYRMVEERVRALPGVIATGVVSDLPLRGEDNNNPATAADQPIPPLTQWPITNLRWASPDYFRAAGIPLLAGRSFEHRDGNAPVVIISANLANRLWPRQNAVGRPLRVYAAKSDAKVIGVVAPVHAASLTQEPTMMIYFPDEQDGNASMSLVVLTQSDPEMLAPSVRRTVASVDKQAAITGISTMRQIVSDSVASQHFQTILVAAFALAALVLASLGIYGVLSFATGRRTAEIGTRMALGARPGQILSSVLFSGLRPVLLGMAAGLALSAAAYRILQRLLFHVQPLDPTVYSVTVLFLLTAATLACLVPARRAARLEPMQALRHE